MRRLRRLAIVLVAIGLVTSAVYATGAFSSLTTSRDANVHVAGDKAGYLGLQPGENGQYTTYRNGKLQLQLNGALEGEDAPSGGGVNREAETTIDSVFTITNQGAQSVGVWLEDTDDHIDFERADGDSLEQQGNAVQLAPGDTVHVGLTIDTTGTDADELDTQLIINADTDVNGISAEEAAPSEGQRGAGSHESSQPNTHQNTDQSNTTQAGSQTEQEVPKAPSDADSVISDDLRELLNQVINAIEDKHDLIKKYEDELWAIGALNPQLLPTIWMLLYPGQVWDMSVGAALGAMGMPNGSMSVKEAGSALYFGGWMASSFAPIVGILPDIRDTVQAMANKDVVESVIGLASIVPGLGKGGDLAQIGYYTSKWVGKVATASGVSKVVDMIKSKSGLLSILPGEVKQKLLSKLTDDAGDAKKIDRISDAKMQRYIDKGYNPAQIDDMVTNGKFTKADIETFTTKGVNLDRVQTLRNKQVPADDIRYYIDNDIHLHRVTELRNQQLSPKQIRTITENGVSPKEAIRLKDEGFTNDQVTRLAENGADINTAKRLKYEDFTTDQIDELVKRGENLEHAGTLKRRGYSPDEISEIVKQSDRSYLRSKDVLGQIRKRHDEGIPKKDIEYYVENGVSLKLVGSLHNSGKSSNKVKAGIQKYVQKNPAGVRKTVESWKYDQDYSVPILNAIVNGGASTEVRKDKQKNHTSSR